LLSLLSNILVLLCHMRSGKKKGGEQAKTVSVASKLRALTKGIAPRAPGKCADWKLPLSFYLSTYGIQAQYFMPFAFTAFSVKVRL
jgi:hypothetical protein